MVPRILVLLLLLGAASVAGYAQEFCPLPPCARIPAGSFVARVIVVLDGDTVMVLHGRHPERIRLADIDAPEKQQDFGVESRQSLVQMLLRQLVTVTPVATDKYGRTVARLTRDDLNINEEQLRRGMAWAAAEWWRSRGESTGIPPAEQGPRLHHGQRYLALQDEARQAGRGLWSQPQPLPPWQWRKTHADAAVTPGVP